MGELKKILLKGLLLIAVLAGLNWVYQRWAYPLDTAAYCEPAALLQSVQDSSDILYLGESSNFTFGDEDVDKRPITDYLREYYPSLRLGAVTKAAMHAGNFYDILRDVSCSSPVKTVIVTMNLRGYDALWINSKLETALQKEMVLLKPGPVLWRRFMLSLRNYEMRSDSLRLEDAKAEWRRDTLHFPYPFPYKNIQEWDSSFALRLMPRDSALPPLSQEEVVLGCHYIKNFAFQIHPETNPRIRDFDRIVALAQDRGWNLVLNMLPENFERAEYLVGKDLTLLMRQNHDLIVERYGKLPGVTLVDQMESLPDREFRDRDWCTEHYFERGRRAVADRIARAIEPLYPGQMRVPERKQQLARVFENDCEGKVIWSQIQTLDAQHAHSGQKASLTGLNMGKFGLTFTYPVANLDTLAMDSIDFSCWVYQERYSPQIVIAWECSGDSMPNEWGSRGILEPESPVGTWTQVHFRAPLMESLPHADVIKVYPYNPEEVPVWFDDIRIEFVGAR